MIRSKNGFIGIANDKVLQKQINAEADLFDLCKLN